MLDEKKIIYSNFIIEGHMGHADVDKKILYREGNHKIVYYVDVNIYIIDCNIHSDSYTDSHNKLCNHNENGLGTVAPIKKNNIAEGLLKRFKMLKYLQKIL